MRMHAELRVHLDQQMHMVRHDFHLQHFAIGFQTHLPYNLLEASTRIVDQYVAAILRTPYNMVFAREYHVVVRLVFDLVN